jgi:uncharacterized membrane protein
MFNIINKHKITLLLWLFIGAYILYFSFFSILRYQTLYASYYDLGIMNQTVYNSYQAIKQKDFSRFLEMTDTEKPTQIKRMVIHNDILLGLLAPLYFIYTGPETLLVIQTIVLALGALAVFGIVQIILKKLPITNNQLQITSLIFSLAYLLYPPMQRANIFDFHPVVLATSFLLFMFYFWLKKKYFWSIVFFILSLLTKENVGLTTALFGGYVLISNFKFQISNQLINFKTQILKRDIIYSLFIIILSAIWVLTSFLVIIPYFRGGNHFAADYYDINNFIKFTFHIETFAYLGLLLGPLGLLSLLSPIQLLIAIPEFAINLLSSNWNMRNIVFHYTSVIQPWVFISAIYGLKKIMDFLSLRAKRSEAKQSPLIMGLLRPPTYVGVFAMTLFVITILFVYFKSPLPFMREQEIHPYKYQRVLQKDVDYWAERLKDESLKISTTGQIAPIFTSRRYFYLFSDRYLMADYVVLRREEVYNYPEKDVLIPVYEKLIKDKRFEKIYDQNDLEVYRKLSVNSY